jgi:Leucine-rich repeat (LRR) protein
MFINTLNYYLYFFLIHRYCGFILGQLILAQTDECNTDVTLVGCQTTTHRSSKYTLKNFKELNNLFTNCEAQFKKLKISNSVLSELEDDAFPENNIISELDLSNNKINKVHHTAFNKLKKLVDLDLSGNQIAELNNNTFCTLDQLEGLNLQNNQITKINIYIDTQKPRLRSLDLSGNNLDSFDAQNIRKKDVTARKTSSVGTMFGLEILDLSENPRLQLKAHSLSGSNEMTHLYLHGNMASQVLNVLLPLAKLEELSMCGTQIEYFYCKSLPNLPTLKKLFINLKSFNQIHCTNASTNLPILSEIYVATNLQDHPIFKKPEKIIQETKKPSSSCVNESLIIDITPKNQDNNRNSSVEQTELNKSMITNYVLFVCVAILSILVVVLLGLYCRLKEQSNAVQRKSITNQSTPKANETSTTHSIDAHTTQKIIPTKPTASINQTANEQPSNSDNVIYSTIIHNNTKTTTKPEPNGIYGFIGDHSEKPLESQNKGLATQSNTDDSIIYAQINFQ